MRIQGVMQDLGFFMRTVNSKDGGGTQKLYFVPFHGYLKRDAFPGCFEGGIPYEDRRIVKG